MTLDPRSPSLFTSVASSRKAPYTSVAIGESEAHLWPSVFVRKCNTEFVP